ncbi:MAG: Ohr family peroxiredoxin [Lysobacter sp.]
MNTIEKVLFTGKTHTTASRDASGAHGKLDITLSTPGGGDEQQVYAAVAPHPTAEQFFAGAWSACYSAAIGLIAAQKRVALPADLAVEVEVDLGQTGNAYFLQARFEVRMPGVAQDVAERIAHAAHEICPYSKATRGNIDVAVKVVTV